MILGVDLRCLPSDGSPGAGVAHAARGLWPALLSLAGDFGVQVVGFVPRGASIEPTENVVWLNDETGASLKRALKEHPVNGLLVASGAVAPGISVPTYPWVHDLAIFDHPKWFPQSWLKRQMTTGLFKRGLKTSPIIFAVSEDTKNAIQRVVGIKPETICVTYEGVEQTPRRTARSSERAPYALILGTVEPRKNIPFIVSLWPDVLLRLGASVQLIIAGKTGWGNVELGRSNDVIRLADVTDEEREDLLRKASVVLVPSLYEGFGRVALEAMAFGVPVIVSDRGALPEVVGDAGYVLPLKREAWLQAITEVFQNPPMAEALARKSGIRAARFTWAATARTILAKIRER